MGKNKKHKKAEAEKEARSAEQERLAVTPPEEAPSAPAPAETATAEALRKTRRIRKRRKLIRRLIVWAVVLAILTAGILILINALRDRYRVTYDNYTATVGTISNSLSYTGSMQLIDNKTYTAPAATKVRKVYVNAKDRVEAGARLMLLTTGETIRADFAGTVNRLDVAEGDEVSAGANLLQLVDFGRMKVSIRISENDIADVRVGLPCRVTVISRNRTFDSEIAEIDYSSSTGNSLAYYTAVVYVDVSGEEEILTGMQTTVTIPQEEAADVVILRLEALGTARDNTAFVYKLKDDGSMEQVPVTVGVSNGNYVEIREGVSAGETVYAVSKTQESTSIWSSFMNSTFGSQRINAPSANPGYGPGQQRQRNNTNQGGGNGR